MNFRAVIYILGWVLNIEGAFMLLPFIVGLIYHEPQGFTFLYVALASLIIGTAAVFSKPKNMNFFVREGFAVVSTSWIVLSIFGCLPFVFTGEIPSFTDALFETISGFTTTGTSILNDIEALSHASLFWRSFTHWLGGMGVLVFLLALLPMTGGSHVHIMRAESPGPSVDKLVPKVRETAAILYIIYFALTMLEIVFLSVGDITFFEAVTTAFGTAGTGGFAVKSTSMGGYSAYVQWVVTIFMILFGINFSFYFLLLTRRCRQALKHEEVRHYLIIIFSAVIIILVSCAVNSSMNIVDGVELTFGDKVRHTFFQVASLITTTGFSTLDYDKYWPETAKIIVIGLMFCGACAGSTGGGIKVSRISTLLKTVKKELTTFFHPKRILKIKSEYKVVSHDVIRAINVFFVAYTCVFAVSVFLVSFDGHDFTTTFTAVLATLNNIGPGLSKAGPACNFSFFSPFAKYVMMFDMLAGRLEIFPMLVLFVPEFWKSLYPRRSLRNR